MKKILERLSIISICLTGIIIISLLIQRGIIGGDVLVKEDKYYAWTVDADEYKEVSKQSWIINRILLLSMMLFGGISVISLTYFGFNYYVPFMRKQMEKYNS